MEATVKSCVFLKEWTAKDGKVGKIYTVEMSDGSSGQSYSEIPSGTSKSDLEITPNGTYPDKIKLIKKNGAGKAWGGGAAKFNNESVALSYSKDLIVAMLPKMEKQPASAELAKVIVGTAETFYSWLESKKKS